MAMANPQGPGSLLFGSFLRSLLFLSAVTAIVTTVLSLLPQMFLHLPQRVQAVLDLLIWSWTRRGAAPTWGELVPRELSLGFRCTLAQVRQDAQSLLLPLLRKTKCGSENVECVSLWGTQGHPRFPRQNQTLSQQACHEPTLPGAGDTQTSTCGAPAPGAQWQLQKQKAQEGGDRVELL